MFPVLLLDGGFSNELSKRCSYDVDKEPLWTAKALLTDTKAVTATHLEYLNAGADIIETATYQATLKGLQEGLDIPVIKCEELIENSVTLARGAINQYIAECDQDSSFVARQKDCMSSLNLPILAGSIGPYGVYLHDGSEYTGNYIEKVSNDEIIELHSKRIEILINQNVDLLALETMPSLREVETILKYLEAQKLNKIKVWVSFVLQEDDPSRTVCGELITEAFSVVSKYQFVWGFGTNCINPKNVAQFLKIVSQVKRDTYADEIKLIVYPNVGRAWISGEGWSNEDVPPIAEYAEEWVKLGANVIGGCCQVGADEIRKLRCVVDKCNAQINKTTVTV